MTTATASGSLALGLPPALRTTQAAVHFPEVQEMLCRLSGYRLGIFMPHMHDEQMGEFLLLPAPLLKVEAALNVNFQLAAEITRHAGRFLPVA